jgi:hypothetical protein
MKNQREEKNQREDEELQIRRLIAREKVKNQSEDEELERR